MHAPYSWFSVGYTCSNSCEIIKYISVLILGHGGSRAAEYLKEHLFSNLMKHPQFMTDTKLAISTFYIPLNWSYFFKNTVLLIKLPHQFVQVLC